MWWERKPAGSGSDKLMEEVKDELTRLRVQVQCLDDERVGLAALHEGILQGRLRIEDVVQRGVTGLREESQELLRRQDRMISDLHDTRGELRELAGTLRALQPSSPAGPDRHDGQDAGPEEVPDEHPQSTSHETSPHSWAAGDEPGPDLGFTAAAPHRTEPDTTDEQGETVENADPQPANDNHQNQGQDDFALKKAIEAAYRGEDTSVPAPPTATSPASPARPADPAVAHGVLLLKAAGVASAKLTAHRDTWEWLNALVVDHDHFRTPPAVEDAKEGRVQTVLSGRSLIAMLIKLWDTRANARPLEEAWAMATTAYNRIAAKLTDVTGGGETIHIVLDDGAPRTTPED